MKDDMTNSSSDLCDVSTNKAMRPKKTEIIDGFTIKYHANGVTKWSKGKMKNGMTDGYWEWYRPDGTLKRSGTFSMGKPTGQWTTYNSKGEIYKVTNRK